MLLVIDNYDSFTFNLVQYLGEENVDTEVHRNDEITLEQVEALAPERILISHGPCTPREAGLSNEIIGAEAAANDVITHGKTSPITHNGEDLFAGIPSPYTATRYHSLVVKRDTVPDCLEITAETESGEVMGLRHKGHPIWGVQFHPESILTDHGRELLRNFLKLG